MQTKLMEITMAEKKINSFEKNLQQLEKLIVDMEDGELPLDKALVHYEKGTKMSYM